MDTNNQTEKWMFLSPLNHSFLLVELKGILFILFYFTVWIPNLES